MTADQGQDGAPRGLAVALTARAGTSGRRSRRVRHRGAFGRRRPSPSLGQPGRRDAHPLGFVAGARRARRREERRIGLDEHAIVRRERRDLRRRLLAAPEDEAREADHEPQVEHRLGRSRPGRRRSGSPAAVAQRPTPSPRDARRASASWASRRPAADRQCRIAGLPVSTASARFRRRFVSWSGIGLKTRS